MIVNLEEPSLIVASCLCTSFRPINRKGERHDQSKARAVTLFDRTSEFNRAPHLYNPPLHDRKAKPGSA